jgi:hypothetical protein
MPTMRHRYRSNRPAHAASGSILALATVVFVLASSAFDARAQDPSSKDGWIALFNGKDLDGWKPKIKGYGLGDNFGDTFRVEDGILKVS